MLSLTFNKVYVDKKWVTREYLRRCKEGVWNKEKTGEALKCSNLERVLDAEFMGEEPPKKLTMEAFLKEG